MSEEKDKKKFKIIDTLEDDAPFGTINWYTISFLSPQKIEKTKYLNVKGFKVHNGYNTYELADEDAKITKNKKKEHDIYVAGMGKICAWDDVTKADTLEYDNEKLNELEKKRRENIDRAIIMRDQFKNERQSVYANVNADRKDKVMKRLHKKLYERGRITRQEYDMMQGESKTTKEIKEEIKNMEVIEKEMMECTTDYLDENDPVGLKYGCVSIFSPTRIGGLQTLVFKVRGLFQTTDKLAKRVNELAKLYPNDRIYTFEVGKWCIYSENDELDSILLEKQLNYSMKCHLDNMVHEEDEFNKRKDKMQNMAETEAKVTKMENKRQKRKDSKKKKEVDAISESNPAPTAGSFDNTPEGKEIEKIFNFLDDPELHDRFPSDKSKGERMEIDPNSM